MAFLISFSTFAARQIAAISMVETIKKTGAAHRSNGVVTGKLSGGVL